MNDTVVLPRAEYEQLLQEVEDLRDIVAARLAEVSVARGESEYLPVEMVERLWAGEHPVRVWREHRGMSGSELANASGVSQSYLSEIETGRKPGSFDAMAKIARALKIGLDDLLPGARDE